MKFSGYKLDTLYFQEFQAFAHFVCMQQLKAMRGAHSELGSFCS